VVPDLGLDGPPSHDPLGGGIRGRGGNRPAFVGAGQGTHPLPIRWATPPAWRGGQAVAPGRKVARHPGHKAWHALGEQGGHAEAGVDHEDFVGLQGRSRLC
jgi:hypothetical protein